MSFITDTIARQRALEAKGWFFYLNNVGGMELRGNAYRTLDKVDPVRGVKLVWTNDHHGFMQHGSSTRPAHIEVIHWICNDAEIIEEDLELRKEAVKRLVDESCDLDRDC